MKKILSIALILGATALLACPKQGMMCNSDNQGCKGAMMSKCDCDTSKLPKHLENLGLNDQQKQQIQKLREEGKAFRNAHHDKMMAVLTSEQRGKLDYLQTMKNSKCNAKIPQKPEGGMGCKNCK